MSLTLITLVPRTVPGTKQVRNEHLLNELDTLQLSGAPRGNTFLAQLCLCFECKDSYDLQGRAALTTIRIQCGVLDSRPGAKPKRGVGRQAPSSCHLSLLPKGKVGVCSPTSPLLRYSWSSLVIPLNFLKYALSKVLTQIQSFPKIVHFKGRPKSHCFYA